MTEGIVRSGHPFVFVTGNHDSDALARRGSDRARAARPPAGRRHTISDRVDVLMVHEPALVEPALRELAARQPTTRSSSWSGTRTGRI